MSIDSGRSPDAVRRLRILAIALAAAPSALLAVASLWWTVDAARGGGLWGPEPVSLSEAVITRDRGEVEWQIGTGADPNAPSRIRAGMLMDGAVTMTPLAAAVWERLPDLLEMLIHHGAVPDGAELVQLRCFNQARPDEEVRAILERYGSDPLPSCDTASPAR
jgi:hypothetical protein